MIIDFSLAKDLNKISEKSLIYKFGSKEVLSEMQNLLLAQTSILRVIANQKLDERSSELKVLFLTLCRTIVAITHLGKREMVNESIMLGRSCIERLIILSYLTLCKKEDYLQFKEFSIQKAYRKLDREVTAGDYKIKLKYNGEIDIESLPDLKAALSRFTSKHGKEITRWSNKSLYEMVEEISNKSAITPENFLMSLLLFYEDASEAIHGTLYGAVFDFGAFYPGFDKNNLKEAEFTTRKKLTLLYWGIGLMLDDLFKLLGDKNNLRKIIEKSSQNVKNSLELMKRAFDDSND